MSKDNNAEEATVINPGMASDLDPDHEKFDDWFTVTRIFV